MNMIGMCKYVYDVYIYICVFMLGFHVIALNKA